MQRMHAIESFRKSAGGSTSAQRRRTQQRAQVIKLRAQLPD
jgi:hypothetical protein